MDPIHERETLSQAVFETLETGRFPNNFELNELAPTGKLGNATVATVTNARIVGGCWFTQMLNGGWPIHVHLGIL